MVNIRVVLLIPNENVNGKILTEEACKKVVERFKKENQPQPVQLGNSKMMIGKLVDLEYDETKKLVVGTIEMNLIFTAGGRILQELKTPDGDRVLECDISGIRVDIGGING